MFARPKLVFLAIIFILVNIPYCSSESGKFLEQIWTLKWNSRVDLLVVNGGPNGVKIYDNNLDEVAFLTSDFIHDVAWSPDGQALASVQLDGTRTVTIKIWDVSELTAPQLKQTITDTRAYSEVIGVDWHPTRNLLAVSGNGVRIWDLDTETPIFTSEFRGLTNLSYDVKWSPDGESVAGLFIEGVKVWKTEGQLAWFYRDVVSAEIVWSPDSTVIAGIRSRGVKLLDATNGQLITTLNGKQGATITGLSTIEWAGDYIIGAGHDNKIYVWNVATGELEQTFQNDVFVSAIEWIPEQGVIVHQQGDSLQINEDIVIKPTIADLSNQVILCLPDDTTRQPLIQLLNDDSLDEFLEAIGVHLSLDDACRDDLGVMAETITTTPQGEINFADLLATIQETLFTLPKTCDEKCFWSFKLGEQTFDDFKVFLLDTFPTAREEYSDDQFPLAGYSLNGITVQVNYGVMDDVSDVVEVLSLSITPSLLGSLTVDYSDYLPDSIIDEFGQPDEVYFIHNPENPRTSQRYSLFMVFSDRLTVYEIEGTIHAENACLTTEGIETISIHRYATLEKLQELFHNSETSHFASVSPDELIDDSEGMCISLNQTND